MNHKNKWFQANSIVAIFLPLKQYKNVEVNGSAIKYCQ